MQFVTLCQGSHSFTDKKSRNFQDPRAKIFQDLFGTHKCVNMNKKRHLLTIFRV